MTGVVLVGGAATRMGTPKHRIKFGSETLLERAVRKLAAVTTAVIVVGGRDSVDMQGVSVVHDLFSGKGPLGGIHAGLVNAEDTCAVVGCDMPFFSEQMLLLMERVSRDSDAAVPCANGYWEPLCAVYRPGCIPAIEALFEESGVLKVSRLYDMVSVHEFGENDIRSFGRPEHLFFNINSPEQLEQAVLMEREGVSV